MHKILFGVHLLIIFLLCCQVQSSSKLKAHYKASKSFAPRNHLRSIIETKRVSLDIPFVKNDLDSIEGEDDSFLETETDNEQSRAESSESDVQNFNNSQEKVNDTKHISKIQFENLETKLEEVLQKLQVYEETLKNNGKSSTDHMHLHDGNLNCLQNCTPVASKTGSCSDANEDGAFVFEIPNSDLKPFYAYCRRTDDGKSWTVIQRREDGSVNFNRGWQDYKHGFGDVYGEYWIGLERLHALTSSKDYELQVYLQDFENSERNAKYSKFTVSSEEEGYKLGLGAYSGDAGDSFSKHNNLKFTTYDQKNDKSPLKNCAQKFKGGWWYHECYHCNLNGKYFSLSNKMTYGGVDWNDWKSESLKRVIMMIRPL